MNTLHITASTYSEIESKLGILTDEGFTKLLDELQDIADSRLNSGMVEYVGLVNHVTLMRSLKLEREGQLGNTLSISNFDTLNQQLFDNQASTETIKQWLLKGMIEDIAEVIDEGFRYGLDDSEETTLLSDYLFYLTLLKVRFHD